MTLKQMLIYKIKRSQIIIGEAINQVSVLRGNFAAQPDLNNSLLNELNQLTKILSELQVNFSDLLIVLEKAPQKALEKIEKESFSQSQEVLEKITENLKKNLPQREVPILPRGNSLALSFFELENKIWITEAIWKEEKNNLELEKNIPLEIIDKFLKSSREFFQIAARWINLLINQKEYIWIEPKKKERQEN